MTDRSVKVVVTYILCAKGQWAAIADGKPASRKQVIIGAVPLSVARDTLGLMVDDDGTVCAHGRVYDVDSPYTAAVSSLFGCTRLFASVDEALATMRAAAKQWIEDHPGETP
jgi:hypothetical protein